MTELDTTAPARDGNTAFSKRGHRVADYGQDAVDAGAPRPVVQNGKARAKAVRKEATAVVRRALRESDNPLETMLDNMHWAMARARKLEYFADGVETAGLLEQMVMFRELAGAAARDAIRYMHAPMAPQIAKGQTGVQVNFVIDGLDAGKDD